jgi:Arc/MetJ-type ribon-helix-helix transcriptional regulator
MTKRPKNGAVTAAVRLDAAMAKQVDEYLAGINAREPGLHANRSDAIRALIAKALKLT